jgi:small GTP-binding protein
MENHVVKDYPVNSVNNDNNLPKKEKKLIELESNNSPQNIQILRTINSKIDYEYLFKIALIGDSATGKTSILLRFTENDFREDTSSTIGVDFKIVSMSIGNKKFAKMQIWDTCGSERFKALTMSFIKSCPAFLLIFDITKYKTFKNLENWIKIINDNSSSKLICLVGNKNDLSDHRQVSKEEALIFAEKHGLTYVETSAKSNERIEEVFLTVCDSLMGEIVKRKKSSSEFKVPTDNSFEIGGFRNMINYTEQSNDSQNNRFGCC